MTTREELRQTGAAVRAKLGFPSERPDQAPGLHRLAEEMVWGSVWARPGLALEDRMLATLSALTSRQRLPQLRRYVGGALHLGLSPRTVQEVFIHCALYSGFPTALNSLTVAEEVFAEKGIDVPEPDMPDLDADALMAQGRETMFKLHGPRAEQGYASPDNPVTGRLYPAAIAYGYGDIWGRPDLDHRQRSVCAVAAFTSIDHVPQVVKFGQAALNCGLSKDEVIEAVMQTGPYSGFPRALTALAALSEAFG